jgi:hypothetical protein
MVRTFCSGSFPSEKEHKRVFLFNRVNEVMLEVVVVMEKVVHV